MSVINEVCGNENTATKNMGGKKQCLEAPVKTLFLAKNGFNFNSIVDAKNKAKWLEAIENKDVVPFPNIEGIEANNTEASIKNGRYTDYELKEAVRGSTYRFDLSICSYDALQSYKNSGYTKVFRVTNEEEVTCNIQDDGAVIGEPLNSFIIGVREEAKDDDVPFANVQLKYTNNNFDIIKPSFEATELEGIFDVSISQVSATASEIFFTVTDSCSNSKITNFVQADIAVKDATGAAFPFTLTPANANGEYRVTPGAGSFANNFTIELNGIVTQTETMYEGVEPLTITDI